MNCPFCNEPAQPGAGFCAKCGARFQPAPAPGVPGPALPGPGGMSVAALVLGAFAALLGVIGLLVRLLVLAPLGLLAGIPAVFLGALVVGRRRPGRGLAVSGIATGGAGAAISIAALVLTLTSPGGGSGSDSRLQSSVKNSMHVFQTALEAWAVDHYGNYPGEDVSWETGDETGIACWFPGGDPLGVDGEPVAGRFPENPYTGRRYEHGRDLFYFPARLDEPGQNAITRPDDGYCPYEDLEAPEGVPGTIVILGYTPQWTDCPTPQEYGIAGFGRDTSEPMYSTDGDSKGRNGGQGRVYFVLHN